MSDIGAWLLDCNGVVFVDDELLPGVADAIKHVRERETPVRFVTNHPSRSRSETADFLTGLGIPTTESEVITSTWATARFIDDRDYQTVFVIGSRGLHREIERVGMRETIAEPDAVVVGVTPDLTYDQLTTATRLLVEESPTFVATNPDTTYPASDGPAPGTGAIIAFLERASGQSATIVGKPERPMFDYALSTVPAVAIEDVVFVGDTIETDVLGAHRAGLRAAYVGTPPGTDDPEKSPDATADSLAAFLDGYVEIPWLSWSSEKG